MCKLLVRQSDFPAYANPSYYTLSWSSRRRVEETIFRLATRLRYYVLHDTDYRFGILSTVYKTDSETPVFFRIWNEPVT